MRQFAFAGLCAPFLLAFLSLTPAHASVVYTASGAPVTGINDSAKATFTLGAGTITVTLDELSQYSGQSDVGLLSGISFVVGPAVSGTTLSSYTYSGLASLSSSGTVTSTTDPGSATHWGTTVSGGTVYLATVGTGAAGAQPYDLIIGPNSSGNFSSSYGSVSHSVINHLPVVLGEATFVISAPGVTSTTTISDMVFNFGTESGQTLTGKLVPSPEPASMVVLASGLLGMGVFARRKTRAR
ncbi:MAG TPA: hypothetical protein VFG62_02990 [Rhodopila sp.]|nr:hypothetical protein [Rhodopila sp.]